MRFLSIYKNVERNTPPTPDEMGKIGKLIEEGMKSGWLLATEGCLPSSLGVRVRISDGKTTVTDGPFTESKRSEEHTSELQSPCNLVCRLLLEKKKKKNQITYTRETLIRREQ